MSNITPSQPKRRSSFPLDQGIDPCSLNISGDFLLPLEHKGDSLLPFNWEVITTSLFNVSSPTHQLLVIHGYLQVVAWLLLSFVSHHIDILYLWI